MLNVPAYPPQVLALYRPTEPSPLPSSSLDFRGTIPQKPMRLSALEIAFFARFV